MLIFNIIILYFYVAYARRKLLLPYSTIGEEIYVRDLKLNGYSIESCCYIFIYRALMIRNV